MESFFSLLVEIHCGLSIKRTKRVKCASPCNEKERNLNIRFRQVEEFIKMNFKCIFSFFFFWMAFFSFSSTTHSLFIRAVLFQYAHFNLSLSVCLICCVCVFIYCGWWVRKIFDLKSEGSFQSALSLGTIFKIFFSFYFCYASEMFN